MKTKLFIIFLSFLPLIAVTAALAAIAPPPSISVIPAVAASTSKLIPVASIINDSAINKNILEKNLASLDDVIKHGKIYNEEKQNTIELIRNQQAETDIDRYKINLQLIELYYAYQCDSTLYYLNQNIEIARRINSRILLNESVIKTASFMAHSAGLYKQASDILGEIDEEYFTEADYIDYYQAQLHIYTQLYTNTKNIENTDNYGKLMELYKDTLIQILPPENEMCLLLVEERLRNQGEFHQALKINDTRLQMDTFGSSGYALATFHRAYTYRMMDDGEKYKYYLAVSALSDIVSATRDHASLWMLAETLLAEKDVDRAYNYMRFSWEGTLLFNGPVRKYQSADILYAIDGVYNKMLEKQNRKLFYSLIAISLLVILFIIALYYNYLHRKKLSAMSKNLQSANEALTESNHIKEEYIGQFIRMCSLYIGRLDKYRRFVIKKIKREQTDELLLISEKEKELCRETDDFLHDFDIAFLNIFPNFVEKFNELLLLDQQIILKKGEILNTELRVYALIRLGISDSAKIAEFLHLSVNTVYNIRAKVRNKAFVTREEFDYKAKFISQ
jgi:hypothetical protein